MKKALADLLKSNGCWSAGKLGLVGTALAPPIGGACMCAAFIFHVFIAGATPDYAQLGIGLGALAGGGGLGSWAHGKVRSEP